MNLARNVDRILVREHRVLDGRKHSNSILNRPYLVFRARKVVAVNATVDAVFEQRLRIVEQRLHRFSARDLHIFGGVLVIGNGSGEEIDAHEYPLLGSCSSR